MELENMSSCTVITSKEEKEEEEEEHVTLPGFRFHPTDEELVGFYLRRKIENKPLSIELIKQADIYKYDPWDLPKSSTVGDKEWYFFCKRGRKYRNSIRPNRVTCSGFWKATGIDRPIYSSGGEGRDCIGLKKSLVYYRGSAGKGTKTDWMMHEFRLPPTSDKTTSNNMDAKTIAQEAEVWTLCRILKRNNSYRKLIIPDWREMAGKRNTCSINNYNPLVDASSKTCSLESSDKNSYISFSHAPVMIRHEMNEKKPYSYNVANQQIPCNLSSATVQSQAPSITSSSSDMCARDINELLRNADWEDLQSIVDCAAAATTTTTVTTNYPFYL